ncbi:MAG: nucleotide exchange factor GrpE [Buchnera aphidicola (Schlechtendalia peitan)]
MEQDKKLLNINDINNSDTQEHALTSKEDHDLEEMNILNKNILNLNSDLLMAKISSEEKIKLLRNRIEKDISNTYKFSLNNFIYSLLPTIDSIECALSLFKPEDKILNSSFSRLENVLKSFLSLLNKFGITIIDESNVPFNPEIHQAMVIKSSRNIKENYVISVLQKGYSINNRLLRPAMVIVSKL